MKYPIFLILCFVFSSTIAQTDIKLQQLETSVQEVKLMLNKLKNDQKRLELQMLKEMTQQDSIIKHQMNEFFVALKDFEAFNQSELQSLKETSDLHQNSITKSLRRQKIHFIILYILLFVTLVGLVFVYVYFTKLAKDFDLFQKKRLDDLKDEVKLAIDSNHKYLISKVDTTCDEVKNQQTQSDQKATEGRNSLLITINTLKSELNSKTDSLEKEQQEQIKLIRENQQLKSGLESLKKQLETHMKLSDEKFALLKNTKAPLKKPANKRTPPKKE
jgi:hypothetical protein